MGAALRIGLIALAVAFAGCVSSKADWDPAAYRAAAERGDWDEVDRQARAAVREQALVGLSRERVHALLGKPDTVWRDRRTDEWSGGWRNDTFGLGDQNGLHVEYDRGWRRVVRISETSDA